MSQSLDRRSFLRRTTLLGGSLLAGGALTGVADAAEGEIKPVVGAIAAQGAYQLKRGLDFGTGKKSAGANMAVADLATLNKFARTQGYMEADGHTVDTLSGNGEWERYRANNNHVFAATSMALVARCPSGKVAPGMVESGMLQTLESWKYGYFELRCKVPPTAKKAAWPAFWITASDFHWPPEVDMLECVINSDTPDRADSTKNVFQGIGSSPDNPVEWLGPRQLDQFNAYRTAGSGGDQKEAMDFSADFHTFAVEWTPDGHWKTYVDQVMTAERTYPWRHNGGADGGPGVLNVNLAFGGNWPARNGVCDIKEFPIAFELDFMRAWQRG
jgi:hypothetical protein